MSTMSCVEEKTTDYSVRKMYRAFCCQNRCSTQSATKHGKSSPRCLSSASGNWRQTSSTSLNAGYHDSAAGTSKDLGVAPVVPVDLEHQAEEACVDHHRLAGEDLLRLVDLDDRQCRMAWDPDLMAWDHRSRHISRSGLIALVP